MELNLIKNILVYLLTYLPPLIVFGWLWVRMERSRLILSIISLFYLVVSIYTQNVLPFILVLLDIYYLKKEGWDYERYNFSIKKIKIFNALRYSFFSYFITLVISAVATVVFANYNIPVESQDVVTWMDGLPLLKFILVLPVAVIFAPVTEEFVFRWFFYKKVLGKFLNIKLSVALSSIVFAAIHYNLIAFPMILWIGIFNCYLMEKKGYWYAVANHVFFNSVTVILMLISKLNGVL